jgi:hypothetical protein
MYDKNKIIGINKTLRSAAAMRTHPARIFVLHHSKSNPPHGKAKAIHHPLIAWMKHQPADTARPPSAARRLEWLIKSSLSISLNVTYTPHNETKNIIPKEPPTFQVGWHLKHKHYSRFAPIQEPPITFMKSKTLKQRYLYRALSRYRPASPDGLNESEAKKVK